MGHITRDAGWCSIDINTATGQVFLQERWRYIWVVSPGQNAWTEAEKANFHNRADRAIWQQWSNRVVLSASGASAFARTHASTRFPVNWDIRWVTAREHWTVTVTKIAAGAFAQSSVQWAARTITLDSNDIVPRTIDPARPNVRQIPVAHEFGHAAGNTAVLGRGDEYGSGHTHSADRSSVMNNGGELRRRHFQTIIDEMNQMIPDTRFAVATIR